MDHDSAVSALAALAQRTRLAIVRRLSQEGPEGLTAGEIAVALSVPPSTLSHHLNALEACAVIQVERHGRESVYSTDRSGLGELIKFLIEECSGT